MGSLAAAHVEAASGLDLRREWPASKARKRSVDLVALLYDVVINIDLDDGARFTTLLHELAHVLCGHLGTPDAAWWPDRQGLPHDVREFEAESVAYLLARRADPSVGMPPYLHNYLQDGGGTPDFSLERVVKVSGDLEDLCKKRHRSPQRGKALLGR